MTTETTAGVRFPVEGMNGASYVTRIECYLGKVDGVDRANIDLVAESGLTVSRRWRIGRECPPSG